MVNSSEPKPGKTLAKQDYSEGTKHVLDESQKESGPYKTIVLGHEFVVFPNVFSPKYFKDSELFAKELPIRHGEKALEIGPGTGVVSVTAALKGASKVVAVDINPSAVENSRENVKKFKLENTIDIRHGDVYDPLQPNEKFNVLFWNVPFELTDRGEISDLEKSVLDPGYKSISRFIKEASQHLEPNGRLYIGFSSTLGNYNLLREIADQAGYNLLTIYSAKSTEVHPVTFEIIEAIKKPKD